MEKEDFNGAAEQFRESGADWITFTSSSTVENFHQRFNLAKTLQAFPSLQIASIGPETTKAIEGAGTKPSVEAATHTIPGLVQAIVDRESNPK